MSVMKSSKTLQNKGADMKLTKLITIFVTILLFIICCAGAKKVHKEGTVTISDILKEAKCPLNEDQAKKLKEFKPAGGRGAFQGVYEIFDEKQTNALKEVFGSSPGRGGGPERPRFVFFAVIFENENCPLTEVQLKELKALPNSREAFQQMRDIFTDKQSEILQSLFNR